MKHQILFCPINRQETSLMLPIKSSFCSCRLIHSQEILVFREICREFYCPYPSLHHIYIGLIREQANIYQSRPGFLDLPFDINFSFTKRKIEGLADVGRRQWFKCVFGCFSEDSFLSSLTERQTLLKQKLDSKCFRFFRKSRFQAFSDFN